MLTTASASLLNTPLSHLHQELGAKMVAFAGYSMPVQYATGLMQEHLHTRQSASLFDVSHMGQLRLVGKNAASALETLMPVDVLGLRRDQQRYGLLLNEDGGILDDLMVVNRGDDLFLVVNGACKLADTEHLQAHIGQQCEVIPLPSQALLALQGPKACSALARLAPDVQKLVFMTGCATTAQVGSKRVSIYVTRSGYTGEDGFEISVHQDDAETLARALLAQPEVLLAGLGARNSLRLEAGLCLYGNDMDAQTTPVEAGLTWAMQKIRRTGGARAGNFIGAGTVLEQLDHPDSIMKQRVGLVALERIPVREHTELQDVDGKTIGEVTSGLLSPSCNQPIAMGYVPPSYANVGTRINAIVRGKLVPMQVSTAPFVPQRYYRG